jgi:hypothetical protein
MSDDDGTKDHSEQSGVVGVGQAAGEKIFGSRMGAGIIKLVLVVEQDAMFEKGGA